jgi:hypothetical protein
VKNDSNPYFSAHRAAVTINSGSVPCAAVLKVSPNFNAALLSCDDRGTAPHSIDLTLISVAR